MKVRHCKINLTMSEGYKVGYARVSTDDQNPERQIDELKKQGCSQIYQEHISGTKKHRPELEKCLESLRKGDTLVVVSLDRLGRSLQHLIQIADNLHERGIYLNVLNQGIDTSTSSGRLLYHILGAVAEFESNLISERVKSLNAMKRRRGLKVGKSPTFNQSQIDMMQELRNSGEYPVTQICKMVGCSRDTFYRLTVKPEP